MNKLFDATNTKFKDKYIGVLTDNPTFIIGQNPGKSAEGLGTGVNWDPSPAADMVLKATEEKENILMTNVICYQDINYDRVQEGTEDLRRKIVFHKPKKIICLGAYARDAVKSILNTSPPGDIPQLIDVYNLVHPSFILRANKDKEKYIRDIRSCL